MRPTNIFRAMQPIRSSLIRFTTPSAITPSLYQRSISTTIPRLNEPIPQQEDTQSSTSVDTTVIPSIRTYPYKIKSGTVVSVGRMSRTVRVSLRHTTYDKHIQKFYPKTTTYLVSDPRDSLREGDVIEFSNGHPKTGNVRHVVERIIAPFGTPIEERPPVMTREERDAERAAKRTAKWQRRQAKRLENGGEEAEREREHVGRIQRLISERMARNAEAK
ncbi:nucleic acid-binding protein [Aspergillus sclerotioniger CBS 115572]|uniref:Nucleic acid-binding protein n=1 Tax=Aspergillus sclerotioniger CBS 115572 TaxID=1450535 RepID=A0A317X9X5_9EURO|nr:nucleic acid-binding protein [Aspergillus sclerotioniger CBS 115572]PWY94452.1 nucleic acid-binding protein [Aspergillus sclerotioniger CBS 115572]